jgi:hypothetical protein
VKESFFGSFSMGCSLTFPEGQRRVIFFRVSPSASVRGIFAEFCAESPSPSDFLKTRFPLLVSRVTRVPMASRFEVVPVRVSGMERPL